MSGSTTLKGAGQCRQASKVCLLFWTGIMLFIYIVCQKKKSVLRSAWFLFYGDVWLFDVVCTKCNGTHTVYHLFFEGVLCVCSKLTGTGCLVSMIAHTYTYMCIAHTHVSQEYMFCTYSNASTHSMCSTPHLSWTCISGNVYIYIHSIYIYIQYIYSVNNII